MCNYKQISVCKSAQIKYIKLCENLQPFIVIFTCYLLIYLAIHTTKFIFLFNQRLIEYMLQI